MIKGKFSNKLSVKEKGAAQFKDWLNDTYLKVKHPLNLSIKLKKITIKLEIPPLMILKESSLIGPCKSEMLEPFKFGKIKLSQSCLLQRIEQPWMLVNQHMFQERKFLATLKPTSIFSQKRMSLKKRSKRVI